MKRISFIFYFALFSVPITFADLKDYGFKPLPKQIHTVEDFFRLYTEWLGPTRDSISRNIYFLELALIYPFDHPIKALTPITNKTQWDRYRYLILMHLNAMLTKAYLDLGWQYYKEHLYFFNGEFKKEYLKGYEIAEFYFQSALTYWQRAKKLAKMADSIKGQMYKTDLIYIEDECKRIVNGDIYYDESINRLLKELRKNREKAKKMPHWSWYD